MVLHRNDDGEVSVKYLGQAIGLIPETNNAQWEIRVTDSGESLEYLTVEGLLWTKWDDPIDIIQRKGMTAQSMELSEEHSGYWDDEGYYVFENFKFFGACLLGEDVLPAMKNSTAELQFSSNNDINKIVENKLKEFNTLFSSQKGGNDLTQETNEKVEAQAEFENVDTTETQVEEEFKTITEVSETTEVKTEVKTIDVEEDMENDKPNSEYSNDTTFEEESTTATETTDEPVNTDETFEEEVKVETETTDETKEEFEETQTQVEEAETTTESDIANEAFAELTKEYEALKVEVEELRKFKRNSEINELYSKFQGKLSKSELDNVFANNTDKSVSDIENLIFVEIGKKNFSLAQQEKQVKQPEIQISRKPETNNDAYGGLFSKYLETK